MKLKAVKEKSKRCCKGCVFNKDNKTIVKNCSHKLQEVENKDVICWRNNIIYKEIKENDMNKMPELKSGMIIKTRSCYYLVLTCNSKPEFYSDYLNQANVRHDRIDSVYIKTNIENFGVTIRDGLLSNDDCIWSKKSDKELKKEEIENTISKLQKQLREL